MKKAELHTIVKRARQNPGLSLIYALEVDRLMRAMGEAPFAYSANGVQQSATEQSLRLKLNTLFSDSTEIDDRDVIYKAEQMHAAGHYQSALTHAFLNLRDDKIASLSLLYSNHLTRQPTLKKHLINKYLASFGRGIHLVHEGDASFFSRIRASYPAKECDGPLITVVMPAHNAEKTIRFALVSVLSQSWRNLEIIVVDDASSDNTVDEVELLAKQDKRIVLLRNSAKVGPYVSRNVALLHAKGKWITVHDADDWAFPDRIQQQVEPLIRHSIKASTCDMLRINDEGKITRPSPVNRISPDGYRRLCFASLMIETELLKVQLGAWDSVWVSGDAEILQRMSALSIERRHISKPLMLCLDQSSGLTRHPELGIENSGVSGGGIRRSYKVAYEKWSRLPGSKRLSIYGGERRFAVPKKIAVDKDQVAQVFSDANSKVSHSGGLSTSFDSRDALVNANMIVKQGSIDDALNYAKQHVPEEFAYTADILRANHAILAGNESEWLHYLNAYLARFRAKEIKLEGSGTVFDRLHGSLVDPVVDGPLISVIMPVWNSARTLRKAAMSILSQSWKNLQLLIVDDASTDDSWEVMLALREQDSRVELIRNSINVGPYVSKNIALIKAKGDWITGHDADDWALRDRLRTQLEKTIAGGYKATLAYKIRMEANGLVKANRRVAGSDAVMSPAFISCFFNADFFRSNLGAWDSVRFGGDGEIINRVRMLYPDAYHVFDDVCSMLCLDSKQGLTNHSIYGITANGLSPPRKMYAQQYKEWHKEEPKQNKKLAFPLNIRPFDCHESAFVPISDVVRNLYCSFERGEL